jgi:DNA-binding response OmpR family regulator
MIKAEHLLVVDDEEATRRSLADILRLEGYQVETASGGAAAIKLLSEQVFDLVVLDLKMPGVDGLEVLRWLRGVSQVETAVDAGQPAHIQPSVILLTAHGSLESAIKALQHGAKDYLLKPCSPEEILKSVREGLKGRVKEDRGRMMEDARLAGPAFDRIDEPVLFRLAGSITIDLARREIQTPTEMIKMTPTEGKLMGVLLRNPGRVFSHRELVMLVQGYDTKEWEAPEVLRPLVSRLRRKLVNLPGGGWITSVRGTGYVFDGMATPVLMDEV